jgi:hypothetical protein
VIPYLVDEAVEDEAGAEEAEGEEQREREEGGRVRAADRHTPRRRRHWHRARRGSPARAHADNVIGLDWVRERRRLGGRGEREAQADKQCSFPRLAGVFL